MGLEKCECCFWTDITECAVSFTDKCLAYQKVMSLEQAALQSYVTFFWQSYHINFLKQSLSSKVQLLVMQDLKRQSSWKMKGNFAINFISGLATLWETDNFGVGSSSLSEFGVLDTTLAYRNMLRLIPFFLMQVLLLEEFLGKSSSCGTQTW